MINKRIKVQKMKTIVLFAVLLPLCFASCAKKKSCCQAGFVHDLCATDSYPMCDNAFCYMVIAVAIIKSTVYSLSQNHVYIQSGDLGDHVLHLMIVM